MEMAPGDVGREKDGLVRHAAIGVTDDVGDRFIGGQILPPDLGGALGYMGLTPEVMGDDVYQYAWAKDYVAPVA